MLLISTLSSIRKPSNEEKTVDWIFLAPKPIVCYPYQVDHSGFGVTTNYTLVNAEAGVYMTGPIEMSLPDTIR